MSGKMEFRIIDVTAASKVRVKSSGIVTVIIPTNEVLTLGKDEVGWLEGRFSHHWKGAYFQGGILNPDWSGKVTCELLLVGGEIQIEKDEQVAHAVILKGKNVLNYTFKGTAPWQEGKPT